MEDELTLDQWQSEQASRLPRVIVWFSCGAASAVAAKLALEKYPSRCTIVYCDTSADEHPDNQRFLKDVERWLDVTILKIKSKKYDSVDDVARLRRYMSGPKGAICTTEMKKLPRRAFERPDDLHIFGYTVEEQDRIELFEQSNPEMHLEWMLRDAFLRKSDCFEILEAAGIKRSAMYDLGYRNANCIGCFKATGPTYWNMIRQDFPDIFALRAVRSREIGCRLVKLHGERIFLDELPLGVGVGQQEDISCGPQCAMSFEW